MLDALNHESLVTFLAHHWLMCWLVWWSLSGPFFWSRA